MNFLTWLGEVIGAYVFVPTVMQWVQVLTFVVLAFTLGAVLMYVRAIHEQNENFFRPVVVLEFAKGARVPSLKNVGAGPAFNVNIDDVSNPNNDWVARFPIERNRILESREVIERHPRVWRETGPGSHAIGKFHSLLAHGKGDITLEDPFRIVRVPVRISFDSLSGRHYVTELEIETRDLGDRIETIVKRSGPVLTGLQI